MPRRSPPPLWFSVCAAVALAVLCRAVLGGVGQHATLGGRALEVQLGFWQLIALAIGWAWNALQAAGQVTLEVLAWAVKALQAGAATLANGVKNVVNALRVGFMDAWGFFKDTYTKVLKPALTTLWKLYNRVVKWWTDTIQPVLDHLLVIRDKLLDFYKKYVRPWLDVIDVTRRVLRVLSGLGLTLAAQLDAELGAIEEKIDAPFQFVLSKVNEIIGIVNRVITADGLFQRVALIKSLGRDYRFAWRAITAPYTNKNGAKTPPLDATKPGGKTTSQIATDLRSYLRSGAGRNASLYNEMLATWRNQLREAA